jgi:organic hydroperoxide reductase OsmC/OhrA
VKPVHCPRRSNPGVEGRVPDVDDAHFAEHAEAAKKNCAVSRALAAVPEIELTVHQVA